MTTKLYTLEAKKRTKSAKTRSQNETRLQSKSRGNIFTSSRRRHQTSYTEFIRQTKHTIVLANTSPASPETDEVTEIKLMR